MDSYSLIAIEGVYLFAIAMGITMGCFISFWALVFKKRRQAGAYNFAGSWLE